MSTPTGKFRLLTAWLGVCTILLFPSCGKGNNAPPPGPLSGNWQMDLQDANAVLSQTEAGFIVQKKNVLSGQLLLSAQSECAGLGDVQGTVNGSAVSMTLFQRGQTVNLTGVISNDGTSMGGTYSILGTSCSGGTSAGTWSATPVKPVTGNYQATLSSNSSITYGYAVNVTQSTNTGTSTANISGTMTSADAPCAQSVTISGVVSGTSIVFNFATSDGTAIGQFRGATSADATTLTGSYDFLPQTNGCTGDGGTISMILQSTT